MLSEEQADLVMETIVLEEECTGIPIAHSPYAEALLQHLYELHKLRDFSLYLDLIAKPDVYVYDDVWNALVELNHA